MSRDPNRNHNDSIPKSRVLSKAQNSMTQTSTFIKNPLPKFHNINANLPNNKERKKEKNKKKPTNHSFDQAPSIYNFQNVPNEEMISYTNSKDPKKQQQQKSEIFPFSPFDCWNLRCWIFRSAFPWKGEISTCVVVERKGSEKFSCFLTSLES